MPSTHLRAGRLQHRHSVESDQLEHELASQEQQLRAKLDADHENARASAKETASRAAPSGGRPPVKIPSHDEHIAHRVDAISQFRSKADVRRKAQRDKQAKELTAARAKPTPGKYEAPSAPESHHPLATIWHNLNSARQNAVRGVMRQFAELHNDKDAQHLDVTKQAGRYMGSQATQDDAQSRAERDHFDIAKREFDEMHRLFVRFTSEIESEKRQIADHAAQRGRLAAQQHDEMVRAGRR
jgi:hypothetical protein